jgi:hypothetical protein
MKLKNSFILAVALVLGPLLASAQIAVTVSPVKITGQKAVVPLAMKNNFAEEVESVRAVCFLLDEQGKVVGQMTRWVIGGTKDKPGLAPDAKSTFNFVIPLAKPPATTNLTAKVSFNRIILEGGKLVEPNKGFEIEK